jgi:hypothetical protein
MGSCSYTLELDCEIDKNLLDFGFGLQVPILILEGEYNGKVEGEHSANIWQHSDFL